MLNSKELRMRARNSLKGKYWLAVVAVIVTVLISSIGTLVMEISEGLLATVDLSQMEYVMESGGLVTLGWALVLAIIACVIDILLVYAIAVGASNYFIRNTYSKPSLADVFSGFKTRYGRNTGALLLADIKAVLWAILLIVPGIIKYFEYSMISFILADDPEISVKDAFKKSKEMMTGNKWRLFKLEFSFVGWIILCIATCGIGLLFLLPYMVAAEAEFYMELKNK